MHRLFVQPPGKTQISVSADAPGPFAAPFPAAKALIALLHRRSILLQELLGLGQETLSKVNHYFDISTP